MERFNMQWSCVGFPSFKKNGNKLKKTKQSDFHISKCNSALAYTMSAITQLTFTLAITSF